MKPAKPTKQQLTRAELEVMQIIWRLGTPFLGEVVEAFPLPRPAYTTISTVIRTLEKKGFLTHTTVGKSHNYRPTISREEYRGQYMKSVVGNFFNNSPAELLSFFAQSGTLTIEQHEELRQIARQIVEQEPTK